MMCFLLISIYTEFSYSNSFSGKAFVGAVSATGNMDLNDDESIEGFNSRFDLAYSSDIVVKTSLFVASSDLDYEDESYIRELYANWSWGNWDFSLGRKILPWGRADKFNPTDNLSPRVYRAVLTDDDEQRWGADLFKVEYLGDGPLSSTLIYSPKLRGHSLPQTFIKQFTSSDITPDAKKSTWAIKTDVTFEAIEASISYLNGISLLPYIKSNAQELLIVRPEHEVFGMDLFVSLSDYYGLRVEFARTNLKKEDTQLAYAPQDFDYAVVGIERQFQEGWLASFQYLGRRVDKGALQVNEFTDGLKKLNDSIWFQTNKKDDALALGISRAPLYGAISGEVGVLYSLSQDSYSLFGEISYDISDSFSVNGYYTNYRGDMNTNLGSLEKNQVVVLELRMKFGL